MLKILFFFVFCVGMLSIPVGFKRLTHGFRLGKLRVDVPFCPEWEAPCTEEVREILAQPFSYLGRGAQCYVFASRDGKYVLKLLRFDQPLNPLRNFFRSWFKKAPPRTPFREKVALLLSSCAIASSLAKEETGTLYAHLNVTEQLFSSVELHIPLGRVVRLPLDRYRFAIQKKAETAREVFLRVYAKGEKEEAKVLLRSLMELFQKRQAKGIWNLDLNVSRNFGFIEGKAVEIDFGSYILSDEGGLCHEREEFALRLSQFLASTVPEWKDL